MTPERQFWITALSQYIDADPDEAKRQAIELCHKYLSQQQKTTQLEEHCHLLEQKIFEMKIDYEILRAELEIHQSQNIASICETKSLQLPSYFEDVERIDGNNHKTFGMPIKGEELS